MSCTPQGTLTPNLSLCKPKAGETGWDVGVNQNWDTIDAQYGTASVNTPRSYLAGMGMVTNGTSSIDIAAGVAKDTGNVTPMVLTATLTKALNAAWTVGSAVGGLFTGTATINTTYHVFVIKRTDTGVVDGGFDTSVTAANIPSPYSAFRRIGSVRTTTTNANILPFVQDGDYFAWLNAILDVNTTGPGTAGVTPALTVPTGITVYANFNTRFISTVANSGVLFSDPATNDAPPSLTAAPLINFAHDANSGVGIGGAYTIRTNTSGQIRYRVIASDANVTIRLATTGWTDRRGRDS